MTDTTKPHRRELVASHSSMVRTAVSVVALALLSACGGGDGGGGGGGVSVVPAPAPTSPAPTPTPSPTPPPAPTGSVASYTEGVVPGTSATNLTVTHFAATNAGLYMVHIGGLEAANRVIKLHGNPAASNAWTTVTPDPAVNAFISMAPSNIYSESDRAVSFYWSSADTSNGKQIYGHYTANSGGVSTTARESFTGVDDFGGIDLVAAGGRSGVIAVRPWVIEGSDVYQDDGAYTAANTITDRFGKASTPPLPATADVAISHPTNPSLYVGAGNRLFEYDADRLLRSWTFPQAGSVSDLIWNEGSLYLQQGGMIYRLQGETLSQFAQVSVLAPGIRGRFCITGGEIYVSNGEAINLSSRSRRSWISKGSLSGTQQRSAQVITAAAASQIYCSASSSSRTIYSLYTEAGQAPRIIAINPMS